MSNDLALDPSVVVDLTDPSTFEERIPHDFFRELREKDPVHWHEEHDGGPGFWVITRHEDVVPLSKDWQTNSSWLGGTIREDPPQESLEQQRMMMLNMDPPQHHQLRKLVTAAFTPRRINELEQHIRTITRETIDAVIERGECDFVTDIALELPLAVIAEMMGVPKADRRKIFDWSNRLIGSNDPEFAATPEDSTAAATEMFLYANELAADKRANPADDITSSLLQAEVDGERLSDLDFDLFFMLLAVAGNETTRNLVSHALIALSEFPDQWTKLRSAGSISQYAIEEFLRWGTPVMYFRRTAQHDYEVGGKTIKAGDKVTLWYTSANRDEAAFDNPTMFDVARSPNPHIAFGGGGPHFCLGANLARLEIRVLFDELITRLPDIQVTGPAIRLRSNFIDGIKHLPIAFTPGPRLAGS